MTNLYLTASSADAAVTAGSGTKWKADFVPGASSTHCNKNSVAGPTAPLQMTDGATAGTDGTVVSWYTEPLRAVTIAGAITCLLWDRENATANNVAPTIRIERTSGDGTVQSTIVSETTSHGAGEMGTTAGGASDTISVTAGNVTDTTLSDGDRLRITLWIDDAAGQGGTGNMASGGRGEFWVNGPKGSAGQAELAFTEQVLPLAGPDIDQVVESTRGTTNPQTVTLSNAQNGDVIYAFAGGDGGLGDSNHVSAVSFSTTAGTTGSWSTLSQQLPSNGADTAWLSIGKVAVTADGSVTVSVNRTQAGTARTWHLAGFLVKSGSSAGEGDLVTQYTSGTTQVVSVAVDAESTIIVYWADWDAGSVGTPSPNSATVIENSSDTNYTENILYWVGQDAGTRNYGTTGASGANIRLHALEILAPSSGTNASAQVANVTTTAEVPSRSVAGSSGVASVTAAGLSPTTKVAPPAGSAAVAAAGQDATVAVTGNANAQAQNAAVTAAAGSPGGAASTNAGTAVAAAAALAPTTKVAPGPSSASAATAALPPGGSTRASSQAASATVAGLSPTTKVSPTPATASVGAAGEQATVVTGSFVSANAQVAAVTAAALTPGGRVSTGAQLAGVTVSSSSSPAVRATSGLAQLTAAALAPLMRMGPVPAPANVTAAVPSSTQRVLVGAGISGVVAAAHPAAMGVENVLAESVAAVAEIPDGWQDPSLAPTVSSSPSTRQTTSSSSSVTELP